MGNYSIRVIQKIIVLFIAMIAGYICKKSSILDGKSTKSLSNMLTYITNPCLILCSLQMEYSNETLAIAAKIFVLSIAIHGIMAIVSLLYSICNEQRIRQGFVM